MSTSPSNTTQIESFPSSKPAFLRRVRIRGYKSIAFCDVTLEPLTILVGRNGSGKSNFLDALGFLRDVLALNLNEAVKRHGGAAAIPCRQLDERSVSIEIECGWEKFDTSQIQCATYRIDIEFTKNEQPKIRFESCTINYTGNCDRFTSTDGSVVFSSNDRDLPEKLYWPTGRPILAYTDGEYYEFYKRLTALLTYNFSPRSIRQLQLVSYEGYLEPDGSNLASVIDSMQEYSDDDVARVGQFLSAIVREIDRFDVVRYGEYETIRFWMKANDPNRSEAFDASSVSDGTLRALAALISVYQSSIPNGSPSVVAIEEPETALHPAAMQALVSALDEAILRTQIVLTTHSPDLLDAEEVKPENVRVVQMIDGATVIGRVDETSVEIVKRKLSTLGGLERDNQLTADLEDRTRLLKLSRNGAEMPG